MIALDSRLGTYCLVLNSQTSISLTVGRLGNLTVQPGYYFYVGSALGPGGLRARVNHHFTSSPSFHWHIDYLRAKLPIHEIWYTYSPERLEHVWAKILSQMAETSVPLARFGASDCRCPAHLFYFEEKPVLTFAASFQRCSESS